MNVRAVGDRALLFELADNDESLRVAQRLRALAGVRDVVPGHRTVLVAWDRAVQRERAEELAEAALEDASPPTPATEHRIGVVYDGADLDEVAALTSLSREEVVARHLTATYTVAFLGFAPGFGYLVGLDERLRVTRREEPRASVPGGTVGIAGVYSGIYPRDSPGGWRLLGRTELVLFDESRGTPALLAAGDRVRFHAL